jgi:hypothetical protein
MLDWLFRNRDTGRITIAQFPNVALWVFIATVIVRWFVGPGWLRTVLDGVALVALAWWAIDEVVRGVNPWRRILGVGGCVLVVTGALALVG